MFKNFGSRPADTCSMNVFNALRAANCRRRTLALTMGQRISAGLRSGPFEVQLGSAKQWDRRSQVVTVAVWTAGPSSIAVYLYFSYLLFTILIISDRISSPRRSPGSTPFEQI